jgi:hypothetical protein
VPCHVGTRIYKPFELTPGLIPRKDRAEQQA